MAMNRRQFLKRTGAATAGAVVGPKLFSGSMVRSAFAETIGDRYFVSILLDGGNDGLNTIIPHDDVAGLRTAYDQFRFTGSGGLNIAPGDLVLPVTPFTCPGTGTQLGFHPGLASLSSMYDAGRVAVIQGVGYPIGNLSHDTSTTIWETANPIGGGPFASSGWAGRHLAMEYGPTDIPGVTIQNNVAGEYRQSATSVLAISRLDRYGFPFDNYDDDDEPAFLAAFNDLYAEATSSTTPLVSFVGAAGEATSDSAQNYPALDSAYESARPAFDDAYDSLGTSMGRDLREIAKIIYGVEQGATGVDARFFQCRNGGYDTHANQGDGATDSRHYELHSEVADALAVFYQDLDDMGAGDKVVTMIWSEFSRRIPQNSNGTDHGSQGPMFVIGSSTSVNGGVYGNHPNIAEAALDDREVTVYTQDPGSFRSTDFRDVYGTLLKNWINMPSDASILANIMPLDVGPANDYWTAQDFDMGFV